MGRGGCPRSLHPCSNPCVSDAMSSSLVLLPPDPSVALWLGAGGGLLSQKPQLLVLALLERCLVVGSAFQTLGARCRLGWGAQSAVGLGGSGCRSPRSPGIWGWSRWETALASSPLSLSLYLSLILSPGSAEPWLSPSQRVSFPWEPFPKLPEGLEDPEFEAVLHVQVKKGFSSPLQPLPRGQEGSERPLSTCPAPRLPLLPPGTPGCSPGSPTAPFPPKSSHGSPLPRSRKSLIYER